MPGDVEIERATDEESEWAAALMARSEPWVRLGRGIEDCREACRRPGQLLFVARDSDGLCGFVLVHPRGVAGSPYVASLGVSEERRGKGVGRRLLDFVERLLQPAARHMFLCVSSFNTGARRFYERQGYAAVGEFEDYIVDGASEILMHKWLRR
jgi:[ribosomal protein S18]-alanine N-acetyltransferase